MLLDVLHHMGDECGSNHWVCAKDWVFGEVQVTLDMGEVVLLHISKSRLSNGHSHVLIGRIPLLRIRNVPHQLIDAWHLDLLQEALNHRLAVKKVRVLLHNLHDGLYLGHTLRFREDVRVRHRNYVCVALEVFTGDF